MSYTATHGRYAAVFLDTTSAGTQAIGTATLTQVDGFNTWTADNSRDFVDTTSFGDASKTSVPGLPAASIDVSGIYSFSGAGSMIKNFVNSTVERGLMIFPNYTTYPTWYLSGKAFASQKSGGGVTTAVTLDLHFEAGPSGLTWTTP